jgi:hypothetical protein
MNSSNQPQAAASLPVDDTIVTKEIPTIVTSTKKKQQTENSKLPTVMTVLPAVKLSPTTSTKKRPLPSVIEQAAAVVVVTTAAKTLASSEPSLIPAVTASSSCSTSSTSIKLKNATNSILKKKKTSVIKKTKKKKMKFSSILSGMMKAQKKPNEYKQQNLDNLRKNLGGGNFIKVDKI